MPAITKELCIQLWSAAAENEIGLIITVPKENIRSVQTRLYEARKEHGDPRHQTLSIIPMTNPDELWIIKQGVELEPKRPKDAQNQ